MTVFIGSTWSVEYTRNRLRFRVMDTWWSTKINQVSIRWFRIMGQAFAETPSIIDVLQKIEFKRNILKLTKYCTIFNKWSVYFTDLFILTSVHFCYIKLYKGIEKISGGRSLNGEVAWALARWVRELYILLKVPQKCHWF